MALRSPWLAPLGAGQATRPNTLDSVSALENAAMGTRIGSPARPSRGRLLLALISVAPAILIADPVDAQATYRVPEDVSNIQAAIDIASVRGGGTVLVAPGTYNELLEFRFPGNVHVKSTGGAAVTKIDGTDLFAWVTTSEKAVVRFPAFSLAAPVLEGFTITGANQDHGFLAFAVWGPQSGSGAGGVLRSCIIEDNEGHSGGAVNSQKMLIEDCILRNNTVSGPGGAVYGSVTMRRCLVDGNQAIFDRGGGLYLTGVSLIEDCVIINNQAGGDGYHGGGVYGPADLVGCVIAFNSAYEYPGIFSIASAVGFANSVTNCTIVGNYFATIHAGDGAAVVGDMPIVNSIIWGNELAQISTSFLVPEATYSCIEGGYPGLGNISADPRLIDLFGGNYRLQRSSPCIDAGDPLSAPDPDGSITDMGAFARWRSANLLGPPVGGKKP